PQHEYYKTSKRGSTPGDGSTHLVREHSNVKRNSISGGERRVRIEQQNELDERLSSSTDLNIAPETRKRANDTPERKLPNSIAIPGLFEEEEDKKNKSGKRSKKGRSATNGSKTSPSDTREKTDIDTQKSDNSSERNPVKDENTLASNIDETGQNAKLLSVRRIGNPERVRKHEEGGDSTSSSISEHEDAPNVFLPKRYILAIMMFMGFVNMYAIRVNLNVAIGAMVNNHTVVRNGEKTKFKVSVLFKAGTSFHLTPNLSLIIKKALYQGFFYYRKNSAFN
ncbi:MAG: hypothetical protein AAF490_17645, partial [Chloroflexota bacterium]